MTFALLVVVLAAASSLLAQRLTPKAKRWKGRYISRPLARRLGSARARMLWRRMAVARALLLGWAIWGGPQWPWIVLFVVDCARDVDDWLYSDDDDDRREDRFRSRVRLKMPAPVRLRPVERAG